MTTDRGEGTAFERRARAVTIAFAAIALLALSRHAGFAPAEASSFLRLDGTSGQFIEVVPKKAAADIRFRDVSGRALRLSNFRGRAVLLNVWATWCPPCIREMPSLAKLQEDFGGAAFEVVALSIDRGGAPVVRAFLRALGIESLGIYLDPGERAVYRTTDDARADALPLYGLPLSFFIDRQGRLVGYLVGAADWNGREARAFIRHFRDGG